MRSHSLLLALSAIALLPSCGGGGSSGSPAPIVVNPPAPTPTPGPAPTPAPTPGPKPTLGSVVSEFSFANDSNGFQAGVSDFETTQQAAVAFTGAAERLPAPLSQLGGYGLSAANPSNDVFVYVWKLVTGLSPNQPYVVTVSLRLATNAPPGCSGSPGESVTIKAGASPVLPATSTQAGRIVVNFDKGNQAQGGANLGVLGDFAQAQVSGTCAQPVYTVKSLASGATAPTVTSDANGQLWLVIGADSGFAGSTKLYFLDGVATFSPATG